MALKKIRREGKLEKALIPTKREILRKKRPIEPLSSEYHERKVRVNALATEGRKKRPK
jgi:hypothetical protein